MGQETLPRLDIVANGVFFSNGASGAVTVRCCEEVLAYEPFDVACVAWHLLVSYFMVRPVDPVLGVTTHIAKYDLVLIDGRYEI